MDGDRQTDQPRTWTPRVEKQDELAQVVEGGFTTAGIKTDLQLVLPNGCRGRGQQSDVHRVGALGDVGSSPGTP